MNKTNKHINISQPPTSNEKDNIDMYALVFYDRAKEVYHIAYLTIFMMIAAIALAIKPPTILLDNNMQTWFCLIAMTAAIFLSIKHIRRFKLLNLVIIIFLICIGGATIFLTWSVTNILPYFIGTPVKITFTISSENDWQQIWQSPNNPQLSFTIRAHKTYRSYQKKQQPHVQFTVYKTPFRLNGIDNYEYQKLANKNNRWK
ncbi:hypothetical protein [Entomomonas asaccharolytica]|uniref:Uncharacterized protein n=1 Tax=Entomomonas asaccharolytica TaxID=2785331 RepID=A0A974RY34_9GAMM|nr:hypothetical protein [Entomomonas asaccharolytica]QQP86752.1 hypothetical protein JHT90_05810 [Entomomonas asaccharolytica]